MTMSLLTIALEMEENVEGSEELRVVVFFNDVTFYGVFIRCRDMYKNTSA
jgi:hypothetical protein